MRNEKKLLAQEIVKYLQGSSYFFLTDFNKVSVGEISGIRKSLRALGGELHVVKNSLFKVALNDCDLPKVDNMLDGQVAVVVGGTEPSEVAKVLKTFHDGTKKEKLAFKGGMLDNVLLSSIELFELAGLPSKDALRAQLLSMFNTPAQQFVRLLNKAQEEKPELFQGK